MIHVACLLQPVAAVFCCFPSSMHGEEGREDVSWLEADHRQLVQILGGWIASNGDANLQLMIEDQPST